MYECVFRKKKNLISIQILYYEVLSNIFEKALFDCLSQVKENKSRTIKYYRISLHTSVDVFLTPNYWNFSPAAVNI